MDASKLSRQELYELVWSKPMVHVAKEFGISDVMLGKICRDRQVPRPPRGYWANMLSVKKRGKYIKPPLPNAPEPEDNFNRIMLADASKRFQYSLFDKDPVDLTESIEAPPERLKAPLQEYKAYIETRFPVLTDSSQIQGLHPICEKVLKADFQKMLIYKRERSTDEPQYQSEKGKLELRFLNCLMQWFEQLGFTVSVTGKKHFCFHVRIVNETKQFRCGAWEATPSAMVRQRSNQPKKYAYIFSWDRQYEDVTPGRKYYEFAEVTPECVKKIVLDALVKNEAEYREWVFRRYESMVQRRKHLIVMRADNERKAAAKRRRELAHLMASRAELMNVAVRDINRADQMRALIALIQAKAAKSRQPIAGLDRWVGWASHHANQIDIRYMSPKGIEFWIKKFQLRD